MITRFAATSNVRRFYAGANGLGNSMMLLYGPEGTGKTRTLIKWKLDNGTHDAQIAYVRATRLMTGKGLLEQVCYELGEAPKWRASDILPQIQRRLKDRPRPIIIDEVDFLFRDSNIEVIRDIFDLCEVPIILAGMREAHQKLRRFPHFYDRVSVIVEFQLLDQADIAQLAGEVCEVKLDQSALSLVREQSGGKLRRIVALFLRAEKIAKTNKLEVVTAKHLNGGR